MVVRTGMETQIGLIQAAVHEAGETDDAHSPLQQKLDEFGEALSKVICAVCVIVWLINIRVSNSRAVTRGRNAAGSAS